MLLLAGMLVSAEADSLRGVKHDFNVPAGDAEYTLKLFAIQAGREIMFPAEHVHGVKTHAVKGWLTANEALERMTDGTGLFMVEDTATGALMVNRTEQDEGFHLSDASDLKSKTIPASPGGMNHASPLGRLGAWFNRAIGSPHPNDNGPDASGTNAGEPAVVLSPFEVNADRDVGYQGGDTTSGSRLNASLKDTAAAIMVFTPEYISDFAASTLGEVVAYAPNLQIDIMDASANALPRFLDQSDLKDTRIRVRGLSASTSRDFFETGVPIDSYNTERFELSSGPNSILFGFGAPGGLVNVMTKRAQVSRSFASARAQFGDWGFNRHELDYNQRIAGDRVALRLNLLNQNSGSWRKWDFSDTRRGSVSFRVESWGNTTAIINYEKGDILAHLARPMNAFDSLALWQASGQPLGSEGSWTAADREFGINRSAASRNIYVTDAQGGGPYLFSTRNAEGFRLLESTYEDLNTPAVQRIGATLVSPEQLPFTYSVAGPGATRDMEFERWFADIERRLASGMVLKIAYTRERVNQLIVGPAINTMVLGGDPNTTLPNPDGVGEPVANPNSGRFYLDANWAFDRGAFAHESFRASAAWNADFGRLGRHQLALIAEHGRLSQFRQPGREILVDLQGVPINNALAPEFPTNHIVRRRYIVPGDYSSYIASNGTEPISITRGGKVYRNAWVNLNATEGGVDRRMNTLVAATQSRFMDSRLVVTAGLRWDDITFDQFAPARLAPDDPGVLAGRDIAHNWVFSSEVKDTAKYRPVTGTIGAVYHASPRFSVFYNHAVNNSQPPFHLRILPDEKLPPPADGRCDDIGFMMSCLGGRVFLRATAFRAFQLNSSGGAFSTTALVAGGDDIVGPANRILQTLREHAFIDAAEYGSHVLGDSGSLTTTYNLQNRGVELSAWMNVSRRFTGVMSFSYTHSDRADVFPEFETWFDREMALWNRTPGAGELVNSVSGSRVDEEIAVIQETVDGIREYYGFSYGERPYKLNFSGRYTFTEGKLKRLYVGGGVRWQGASKLGREVVETTASGRRIYGDVIYGPDDFKVDAFAGYRRRVSIHGRRPELTVQLNITNLTNEDEWMPLRYNVNKSGLNRVLLFEPRKIRVTMKVSF